MTFHGKADIIPIDEKPSLPRLAKPIGGIHMEALSVKAGILANLFGILGIIGLAILFASVIWLVIRVANFDSVLPSLLCVLISLGLIAGGLALSPTPDYQPEPLKMPWEILLDWVGGLRNSKPETEEPAAPEGDEPAAPDAEEPSQPEMERMDVVHTSAPAEGSEPAAGGNPAENGGAAPASAERDRLLVDEVISGWRVRLTLPREWKDSCVVGNDGSWLSFSQKAAIDGTDGLLFALSVHEGPYDFDAPDALPACKTVLEKEGMTLLAIYPSDVQFDMEHMDEYNRMQEGIPGILNTVEFERA